MFEAILFDRDGVVIDTHQAVTAFWEALARKHDVLLTPAIFDQYSYGSPATYTLDHVFPQLPAGEREDVIQSLVAAETNQVYTEGRGEMSRSMRLRIGADYRLPSSGL